MYQIWYDDPESLKVKFKLIEKLNLRGAGMWEVDQLDYKSNDPEIIQQTRQMWNAFPKFRKTHNHHGRVLNIFHICNEIVVHFICIVNVISDCMKNA